MKNIFGFIFLLIAAPQIFAGSVYYVDIKNGNDNNNGLSPATAWKTISKVNKQSFSPGDSILLKRGEVWREKLDVPSSGVKGHPIKFGAYGTGAKPIINGADLVTGWILTYGNIWQATCTTQPNQVFFNNVRGRKAARLGALDAKKEWFWDSNVLYVYHTEDPDGSITIEASSRICISVDTKAYIDITGLTLTKPNLHGVGTNKATYLNVYNNTISYTGKRAIHINNGTDHCNFYRNTLSYCGVQMATQEHGIYIDESDDIYVYLNEISHSWDNGLIITGSNRVKIFHNYFHDNNDEGIAGAGDILIGESVADTTDIEIYYNLFKTGNSYAIITESFGAFDVTGVIIYNNSFYGSTDDYIIRIEDSINCRVKNNIFYARGNYVFFYDNNSNFSSDYNCYYNWQRGTYIGYSETAYVTWATWSNTETNSINVNPSMTDPANDDFSLKMASPCINAGTDLGLLRDYAGNKIPYGIAVDIGALEYIPNNAVVAEINASPTSGSIPLTVYFTGNANGGTAPYSYKWDFGDGKTSSVRNPSHTYNSAGNFTVKLTVTDSRGNSNTGSIIIKAAANLSEVDLLLFTATGEPSPGQGGTTNPQPGNHSYAIGRSVQIEAIPNSNYRFSKWNGDIADSEKGKYKISVSMNTDKSISAFFCVKCGDVTGDLTISPQDSQTIFDIFLGKLNDPTECQKENADVNNDGTKTDPFITPADAQAIFNKYLGKSELPGNCSIESRTSILSEEITQLQEIYEDSYQEINLIIDDVNGTTREIFAIPVVIDNPNGLDSFGFDLAFPSENLRFIGVEKTDLIKDFHQVDGYESHEGILRVGGYSSEPILSDAPGELVRLLFMAIKETEQSTPLFFIKAFDDIKNAIFNTGTISISASDYKRTKHKKIIR